MELHFPDSFIFGTSTAACQIETAFEHDWSGHISRDGNIFNKTTDHEKRYQEDVKLIASLAPNYRMSLMWSRLQRSPLSAFHEATKNEYHELLQNLKQYQKPIIITVNGICTHDDTKRGIAIRDYLEIVHDAIQNGIDVQGYFHWSAWDNFEWSLGPTYQFGLYECHFETKERLKKPSADIYARIAHTRTLRIP